MQIRIPIPRFVTRAIDAFSDWSNVEVWRRGRIEVRRIDVAIVVMFLVCVGYYYLTLGWMGAVQGGALYLALLALSVWVF